MTDKLGFGIIHGGRTRPGRSFYGDLFPYFDQIGDDRQPNPTQRITKGQPICIRLRRKKKTP